MQTDIPSASQLPALLATMLLAVFVGGGCEEFDKALNPQQPASSDSKPTAERGEFLDEPGDADPDGIAGDDAGPDVPQSAQSAEPPIRLSVGIALAQTLPTGTGMSFSVDYQFLEGRPNSSNRYLWVMEGRGGKSQRQPVQLSPQGNLLLIVPGFRPEDGPFSSHIVELTPGGSQRRMSRSISMR